MIKTFIPLALGLCIASPTVHAQGSPFQQVRRAKHERPYYQVNYGEGYVDYRFHKLNTYGNPTQLRLTITDSHSSRKIIINKTILYGGRIATRRTLYPTSVQSCEVSEEPEDAMECTTVKHTDHIQFIVNESLEALVADPKKPKKPSQNYWTLVRMKHTPKAEDEEK